MTNLMTNIPEYSVSEISSVLKKTIEDTFGMVRIRGELSGVKLYSSGHLYFSLKDNKALIDGVCWKTNVQKLGIKPSDGMEVIVTGRLTIYGDRSKYQIIVESIEVAGVGALLKLLEDRKKSLAAMGLFDAARKKPLPFLPQTIGIVTSPTGAVIHDILHRLKDRFPCHVIVWPVAVQGDGAAAQIAAAIEGFNALNDQSKVKRPDLIIVARGGGSVEDLWAFNEEIVVKAAAASTIPLISAVGHETDTTLIDYAADLRAPTPTAAAELAVPVRSQLLAKLIEQANRLDQSIQRRLIALEQRLEAQGRALRHPGALILESERRLDDRGERLRAALPYLWQKYRHNFDTIAARLAHAMVLRHSQEKARLERQSLALLQKSDRLAPSFHLYLGQRRLKVQAAAALLESLSYHKILERGYAVIRDTGAQLITSKTGIKEQMLIEFNDGVVSVALKSG